MRCMKLVGSIEGICRGIYELRFTIYECGGAFLYFADWPIEYKREEETLLTILSNKNEVFVAIYTFEYPITRNP